MKKVENCRYSLVGICILISNNGLHPGKFTINRILQTINDLKRGLNNSDNFGLVQGCTQKMAKMPLLAMQELCTYF